MIILAHATIFMPRGLVLLTKSCFFITALSCLKTESRGNWNFTSEKHRIPTNVVLILQQATCRGQFYALGLVSVIDFLTGKRTSISSGFQTIYGLFLHLYFLKQPSGNNFQGWKYFNMKLNGLEGVHLCYFCFSGFVSSVGDYVA